MTKCIGCGYKLQSDDSRGLGYVPDDTKKKAKYCQRCYKIIHYNDAMIVDNPKEVESIIKEVNKKGKFAFYLVDFLNINNETLEVFNSIKVDKCLVISKSDIIPGSVREIRLKEWLKDEYSLNEPILFVSALRNNGVNKIIDIMKEYLVSNAYILGFTNSGKSSLINRLYEKNQEKKSSITTSVIPNTTMDFIYLRITDDITLIDSPGFVLKHNIYENDEVGLIKKVNAKTFIKPVTYQMKNEESIVLEDKFRFENLGDRNSFTFYVSGKIELSKIFVSNNGLKNLELKEYEVNSNSDIVIKGVGFINIKESCRINIYSNNHDLIEIRRSIFRK